MPNTRLRHHEAIALVGADQLTDDELIASLVELAGEVRDHPMIDLEDLVELAVVCLVAARRVEDRVR